MMPQSRRPLALALTALLAALALVQAGCLFDTSIGGVTSRADVVGGQPDVAVVADFGGQTDLVGTSDTDPGVKLDYHYESPDSAGSDTPGTADTSTPDVVQPDTTTAGCEGPGFAVTPLGWPLPFSASYVDAPESDNPARFWVLRDMDGDERPDLVVTYVYGQNVGKEHWLVYLNNGSGFATAPIAWTLPFGATRTDSLGVEFPVRTYFLRDLNGDKRPDLVVSYVDGQNVGQQHWLVYLNTGSGFAQAPVSWSIPFGANRPDTLELENPLRRHTLVDMDGDERPDLLVTYVYGDTVGQQHWLVYLNNGNGFAATPLAWPIPFGATRPDTQQVANPTRIHMLLDMDGDKRPELVVTFVYNEPVGAKDWRVYPNNGSGFVSTPLVWPIPFAANRPQTLDVENPIRIYTLTDMDGDERPDLLVTFVYDQSVGTHNWLVHRNSGTGFEATPHCFPIPFRATRPETPFDVQSPLRIYALRDMNGDKRPDLVHSFSYGDPPGTSQWWVYPNDL